MAVYLDALDVNQGFVDALTVWSEFLTGARDADTWAVISAQRYLRDLGCTQYDHLVLDAETRKDMTTLLRGAELMGAGTTKSLASFPKFLALVNKLNVGFFRPVMGVELAVDPKPNTAAGDTQISLSTTLEATTRVVASENSYQIPTANPLGTLSQLYDTVPRDPALAGYDVAPPIDQNVYDVVPGLKPNEYFVPPPPETVFERFVSDAKNGL